MSDTQFDEGTEGTEGAEWAAQGTDDAGGDQVGSEFGADDRDAQATWVYSLLEAAGLLEFGLDPYSAPDGVHVASLVYGDFADSSTWPELSQVIESQEEEAKEQLKQKLKTALEQVGEPPPSQW